VNQPLPGIVCTQFFSKPTGALGPNHNIHRSIGIGFDALVLAAHTGGFLVGLQHRAGLVVIHNHRPEILYRDVGGYAQPVGFAAVEGVAVG